MMRWAAFFCCAMASVMLCSCGDDDNNSSSDGGQTGSSKAAYWTISITRSFTSAILGTDTKAETDQNGYVSVAATYAGTTQTMVNDKAFTFKSTNIEKEDSVVVLETIPETEFTGDKMRVGAYYTYTVTAYAASGEKIRSVTNVSNSGKPNTISKDKIKNYYPHKHKFIVTVGEGADIKAGHTTK